jgi:magnesium transporter
MFSHLVIPDIKELIEQKNWKELKAVLSDLAPQDIAEVFNALEEKNLVIAFRLIPKDKASDVFAEIDPSMQEFILRHIADKEIKELIQELPPDDRTALFEDLPGQLTQKILNLLPAEERIEALQLLGYPEDSVGRLMTPDYIAVKKEWPIAKALQHIRQYGKDAETIDMIFVVDTRWKLLDDIPIRRFILAETDQTVADIMDNEFVAINATEDQEVAYRMIKKYNLNVLPVIDNDGILLGIVTVDDMLDVSEEEITEDFQKISAIEPIEERYATVSAPLLYKKRIGWLMILLITDFLSSSIIAHFENAIQAVIALAFFIPVLIDSGGNIAAQSSTLIIRALATGELSVKRWFSVVKKNCWSVS